MVALPVRAFASLAFTWSTPSIIGATAGGALANASCPSMTQCTAVDEFGYAETFDPAAPQAGTRTGLGQLTTLFELSADVHVACPTVSQCTAYGNGVYTTFNPLAIASPQVVHMNLGTSLGGSGDLACPSVTQCTALDEGGATTFDPQSSQAPTFTPIDTTAIATFGLLPLSCPTTTECVTLLSNPAGAGNAVVTFDPHQLGAISPVLLSGPSGVSVDGLSCPSATECVAVDSGVAGQPLARPASVARAVGARADVIADSGGGEIEFDPHDVAAAQRTPIDVNPLVTVDCPSTTECIAPDDAAQEVTFDPSDPSTAVTSSINLPFGSVTCPSVSLCVAVAGSAAGGSNSAYESTGTVASGSGTVEGKVTDENGDPVSGASVTLCGPTGCVLVSTDASGAWSVSDVPAGAYTATILPPGDLDTPTVSGTLIGNGPLELDATLHPPSGPLAGTTIGPASSVDTATGVPTVDWHSTLTVSTHACSGGSGSWVVRGVDPLTGNTLTRSGPLSEGPPGTYSATIPQLYPIHGTATVTLSITCPGASTTSTAFDIYVDPSGEVVDQNGNPVSGATVTLLRADTSAGPFIAVPDGSTLMSPANRTNPDTTASDGLFGWDVAQGYYEIHASKSGCHAPGDPQQPTVTSAALPIPPPVEGLLLTLDCPTTPPVLQVPSGITAEASGPNGATVTFSTSAIDVDSSVGAPTCSPRSGSVFAIGTTTVNCSATNAASQTSTASFTVTVRDTTPPTITGPGNLTANATTPAGASITFSASAADLVDGSDPATCTPASSATFPIGHTTVTCSSADRAGNQAVPLVFDVYVKGAADQIAALNASVSSDGIAGDTGQALHRDLSDAASALADNRGTRACRSLRDFAERVVADTTTGRGSISLGQAADLVASTLRIETVLSCLSPTSAVPGVIADTLSLATVVSGWHLVTPLARYISWQLAGLADALIEARAGAACRELAFLALDGLLGGRESGSLLSTQQAATIVSYSTRSSAALGCAAVLGIHVKLGQAARVRWATWRRDLGKGTARRVRHVRGSAHRDR